MEVLAGRNALFFPRREAVSSIAFANEGTSLATTRQGNCPGQRLVCRVLPKENSRNPSAIPEGQNVAVKEALEALETDVSVERKADRNGQVAQLNRSDFRKDLPSPGPLRRATKSVSNFVLNAVCDTVYKPSEDYNVYFSENFGPVDEIGGKVRVHTVSGAIPSEFPAGVYIRTGPNPQFGGKFLVSPLGITKYHWFEGDGMLHATYFEKRGETFDLFYNNKYVETETYLIEKQRKKPTVLAIMEGTPVATVMNGLLNQLRYGFWSKPTGNTSVFCHGGRVYAAAENSLPHEINVSDLSTVGTYDCFGAWNRPSFTAHPKIDPRTKEMVTQGCDGEEPFYFVGTISADGKRLLQKVDLDTKRTTISHELAITERYIIAPDFPLVMDMKRFQKGESLIKFEEDSFAKLWVIPRFGDGMSVQSFPVEVGHMFHIFNSYEDGNEIVIQGLRTRSSFFNCDEAVDRLNWFRRGITLRDPTQEGYDPLCDGAIRTYVHEWRIDMEAGTVIERRLMDEDNYIFMEMPRINEAYTGRKYKYGYALGMDYDKSMKAGMGYYGKFVKVDFSSTEEGKEVRTQCHQLGPNRYASEPIFIARTGATDEDDGWVIGYVYDEGTCQSEAIIIDAQRFEEEPLARILLPQRVPFGFHGTYVQGY